MKHGIFTISLDFELHWGGSEKWTLDAAKKKYFDQTRSLIPKLLNTFQQHKVHVSWATVGLLMHRSYDELKKNIPALKPSYEQHELSAYHYIENRKIGHNENDDPYHFADSLIREIMQYQGQEIASHSFAHYYCNEAGQSIAQFKADCEAISQAALAYDKPLISLVFPRNQYNADYLSVCASAGIRIIRSNPVDWWWNTAEGAQKESAWKRLNRGLDAYLNLGGKTSYGFNAIKKENGVYKLPASRLLRPFNPKEFLLNEKKIRRIKTEMTIAAKNNEFYHLWWHPHNFGLYASANMKGLRQILNHYTLLQDKFSMKSLNMGEIAEHLDNNSFSDA